MKRIAAFLLLLPAAAARADLEPGNWEMTINASVDGAGGAAQPITQTRCVTADDARDPSRLVGTPTPNCQLTNKNDTGSSISFAVACGGQVPMRGSGVVNYTARAFNGQIELSADVGQGQKLVTRSSIAGRRLGPC